MLLELWISADFGSFSLSLPRPLEVINIVFSSAGLNSTWNASRAPFLPALPVSQNICDKPSGSSAAVGPKQHLMRRVGRLRLTATASDRHLGPFSSSHERQSELGRDPNKPT